MADERIFRRVLEARNYVANDYLFYDTGLVTDVEVALKKMYEARDVIRTYLDNDIPHYPHDRVDFATWKDPVLLDMAALAEAFPCDREELFAIDGTPATPHLRYSAMQLFAVAVMGMSYATLEAPETVLTCTKPTDTLPAIIEMNSKSALLTWVGELDMTETNQSWPTTFREYIEREYAMAKQWPFTIIDGPLLTQNLITQEHGRELLQRFLSQPMRLCGVIKSIQSNTAAHRAMALALHPGEALLIEPVYDLVTRRMERIGDQSHEQWIKKFFGAFDVADIRPWRGVYRPVTKAFGFECDVRHIHEVIAMLWHERDTHHLGHEIPFLLNQVDAHLRSQFNAASCKNHLVYRLGLTLSDDELLDEINEREFR